MQNITVSNCIPDKKRKTILLVEDETITSMYQAQFLAGSGYNVLSAIDGETAVFIALGNTVIDLILMDIDLGSGIDGTRAASLILSERDIPILFLTSHSEEEMVRKVKNVTRYGYVVKNSGEFVLLSSIEMAFQLSEAHRKTKEREEYLDVTLQSIADCVISTDPDGKIVRMNRAAEHITGWKFIEAAGKYLYDVFHVTDAESVPLLRQPETAMDAAEKVVEIRRNLILISRNGDLYRINKSSSMIKDDQGDIRGKVIVFRDITGEYEAHKALMEKGALMRGLFENMPSGVVIFRIRNDGAKGTDYIITDVNSTTLRISRHKREELIGSTLIDIIPDFEEYDILPFYRKVWETGKTECFPSKVYKNDRLAAWFDNYVFKLPTGEVVTIFNNVSNQKKAEEALRESEARYRLLADNTGDSIWTMDLDLRFTYLSPSAFTLKGHSPDEVLAYTAKDIMSPESVSLAYKTLIEELENDRAGADPKRTRRLLFEHNVEGKPRWLESTLSFIRDTDGKPAGVLGATRDVTERKFTEDALRESEKRYRLIADNTADNIWTMDMNLQFTYSSPSVFKLRGYTPEETLSQRVEDTVTPDSIHLVYPILKEEIEKDRSGAPFDRERRVVLEHFHKDGHKLWLESSLSFMRDENGNVNGILGVTRDVTDRKRVEDALRESEEKLHLIMDGVPAYVAYLDSSEKFIYVNRAYADLHGKTKEELIGRSISEAVHPDYQHKAEPYYRRVLKGERVVYEITLTGNDGLQRVARVEYVPHISGDSVVGFFALILDITEQKKSTEKVLSLLKEKELLLKEVHHRIKNNMGSIASLLYLQSDRLESQSAIGAIQDARSRVLSMMGIYEMLYKSEDYRSVSVYGYMNDLIEKISSTYISNTRIKIDKHIEDFTLDSSLLFPVGMIVNELLTNALKYAFPDGKSGNICVKVIKNNGKYVELSVKDTGIGLPESGVISKSRGFGLSLVNMLVQQVNGKLCIVKNGGTEFRISFLIH